MEHLSHLRLAAGLGQIRDSPQDDGRVVLVVRRPVTGVRELPEEAMLDHVAGLAGDDWLARGSMSTPDGSADPQRQVTVMNARVAELVAGGTDRMALAGDQLYIDLDLSVDNLPAGSLLAVGQAVLQVSDAPHLGCAKFVERFGAEAMRFVNSRVGRQLRLRGMNTRVAVAGIVRPGDFATKAHAHLAASQSWELPANPGRHSGIAAPACRTKTPLTAWHRAALSCMSGCAPLDSAARYVCD
jgi:MOSC domain-containing protein YiiM